MYNIPVVFEVTVSLSHAIPHFTVPQALSLREDSVAHSSVSPSFGMCFRWYCPATVSPGFRCLGKLWPSDWKRHMLFRECAECFEFLNPGKAYCCGECIRSFCVECALKVHREGEMYSLECI